MTILISALVFTVTLLLLLAGYSFLRFHRERPGGCREGPVGGHRRPAGAGRGRGRAGRKPCEEPAVRALCAEPAAVSSARRMKTQRAGSASSCSRPEFGTRGRRSSSGGRRSSVQRLLPCWPSSGYLVADRSLIQWDILLVLGIATFVGFYLPDFCLNLLDPLAPGDRSSRGSPTPWTCSSSASRPAWGSTRRSTAWPRRSG